MDTVKASIFLFGDDDYCLIIQVIENQKLYFLSSRAFNPYPPSILEKGKKYIADVDFIIQNLWNGEKVIVPEAVWLKHNGKVLINRQI